MHARNMRFALTTVSPFEGFASVGLDTQGGAALALGWYVSAPSGRCCGERKRRACGRRQSFVELARLVGRIANPSYRHPRRGQSVVEFALMALVTYLVLAATLTFGHLLFCAQTVQQAADVAARELAHTPLPAVSSDGVPANLFKNVFYSSDPAYASVRQSLFDPSKLSVDSNDPVLAQYNGNMLAYVAHWPLLNQMLYPAMIVQIPDDTNPTHWYLWYPGAVPCTDSASGLTIPCVAHVLSRASDGTGSSLSVTPGTETIEWVPVIEEIQPGAFSVAPTASTATAAPTQYGIVALRINYGYQSSSMSAFATQQSWPPQPTGAALGANDGGVQVSSAGPYTNYGPPYGSFPQSSNNSVDSPTYSGPFGLGAQQAWGSLVRPFRRLLSMQAVYRREVFQ
jgi:Flp pilus assembly protein TadG